MAIPTIDPSVARDPETMSVDELRKEYVRLGEVLGMCQDQRSAIRKVMERRQREAAARQRIGALSDLEKEALITVLKEGRR